MTTSTKRAVVALVLCALLDTAAGPVILAEAEPGEALSALAFLILALGVLTAIAAAGIARGRGWAIPLALVTRAVDVLGALPGLGAGPGPTAAVIAVTVISMVAVAFVLGLRRAPALP